MTARAIRLKKPEPISGFPRVASKIASDPDKTTVLFRRFDRLSARNILYLEAEIAELEAQQNAFDYQDHVAADQTIVESHTSWNKFERHAHEKNSDGKLKQPGQGAKMELVLKIRKKLKEYHETLAVHQALLNSKPPATTTVKAMKAWFLGQTSGETNSIPQLFDSSKKRFEDPNDLVALRVPADQDRLSEFILNHFGAFFKADASDGHSTYIREHSLARCMAILSSLLSAVLLFGSIASLYFVHNPYAVLGMLGGWTILFSISVGWLTNAKRDQVFAATAAYAAVLVVFVSGTLGGALPAQVFIVNGTWICTQK
ncbi:hypothetical protein N431DRAFT_461252 [Stipitochalara longipes BDJ]|nr:hypothetical protein N431DRAFT_461252 [Stipitochalara longipes BDJ]